MRRYSNNKQIDEAVRKLLKGDWKFKSLNRHVKLENSVTNDVITVPRSPSDHRAALNWLQQAKSCGAAL